MNLTAPLLLVCWLPSRRCFSPHRPAARTSVCAKACFSSAIYIILATNLNLVIGYTGYVNFGNIVFFGLGGYIGIYLLTVMGWPLILAALAAGFAVSGIALLFGLGILRLRGAFFALATIGVNEAVKAFVSNFEPWGGVVRHVSGASAYAPFGGPRAAQWTIYYMMIGVMGLSLFLSYGIKKSKFGLGLFAIREDEDAAAVLGVKTPVFKAIAYSVSGFPAGPGGRAVLLQERLSSSRSRPSIFTSRSRRSSW